MQKKGNKYGTHRVIEPKGVLPQPANKIDNNMDEIYDNEILIDVQTLNIDSASFTDIHEYAKQQAGEGASEEKVMEEIKKEMLLNVELQGKHRNRRTGSGGMLLGKVEKIGDALKGKIDLKEGDRILYVYGNFTKEYQIKSHVIIESSNWAYLEDQEQDKNTITLITCVENQPDYRRCVQGEEI